MACEGMLSCVARCRLCGHCGGTHQGRQDLGWEDARGLVLQGHAVLREHQARLAVHERADRADGGVLRRGVTVPQHLGQALLRGDTVAGEGARSNNPAALLLAPHRGGAAGGQPVFFFLMLVV